GHVQVAVDAVEVEEVELLERLAVAVLCPGDERTHLLRRGLGPGRRLGHRLGHAPEGQPLCAEAYASLAGEALDADDAMQGDRVTPVLCVELERALGADRALERVCARSRDESADDLTAVEGDLDAHGICCFSQATPPPT